LVRRKRILSGIAEDPPELEDLDRLLGELCISHQLVEVAFRCAASENARADLGLHRGAIEDLGFGLRVLRADLAGSERPVAASPVDGRNMLGYGSASVGGVKEATFGSALSSLAGELSIAAWQADRTEEVVPRPDVTAIRNELRAFQAMVHEWEGRAG
jgi:hypothetical protein